MPTSKQIAFNHGAPDLTQLSSSGEQVQLSSLWVQQPLLLAFTRHFGCTPCKEMLNGIVDGKDRIPEAGLASAIILQGTFEATASLDTERAYQVVETFAG